MGIILDENSFLYNKSSDQSGNILSSMEAFTHQADCKILEHRICLMSSKVENSFARKIAISIDTIRKHDRRRNYIL